jgi:hypothetical protein
MDYRAYSECEIGNIQPERRLTFFFAKWTLEVDCFWLGKLFCREKKIPSVKTVTIKSKMMETNFEHCFPTSKRLFNFTIHPCWYMPSLI